MRLTHNSKNRGRKTIDQQKSCRTMTAGCMGGGGLMGTKIRAY
nr:MAG TPA: hypothetical protein [Bacteriophage sp.]